MALFERLLAQGAWAADSETNATHCCPVPILPLPGSVWAATLQTALGPAAGADLRRRAAQLYLRGRAQVKPNAAAVLSAAAISHFGRRFDRKRQRLLADSQVGNG